MQDPTLELARQLMQKFPGKAVRLTVDPEENDHGQPCVQVEVQWDLPGEEKTGNAMGGGPLDQVETIVAQLQKAVSDFEGGRAH